MASLGYFNSSLIFQFSIFQWKKILKLKATVSTLLFCALVLTVLVFIKIAFSPFQRRINTCKSRYCAIVPWWLLCLHIVIMDSINCSRNYHFSIFAYISNTHYNFSICCRVTPSHGGMTMHLSFALPCTGLVQFVKNSYYYFGTELSVGFSVNLLKALLAIIAIFFSRDAIILGCICCFLW